MPFIEEGSRSTREGGTVRQGAVHQGREPFIEGGEPFIEVGSRLLRDGVVLREREPFFERGSRSLREGAIL